MVTKLWYATRPMSICCRSISPLPNWAVTPRFHQTDSAMSRTRRDASTGDAVHVQKPRKSDDEKHREPDQPPLTETNRRPPTCRGCRQHKSASAPSRRQMRPIQARSRGPMCPPKVAKTALSDSPSPAIRVRATRAAPEASRRTVRSPATVVPARR